jgi:hypothetical protein
VHSTRGWEDQFQGIIECYNTSGRANAIRGYTFWVDFEGEWKKCFHQQYKAVPTGSEEEETFNPTPLVVPPYSGVSFFVMAFSPHTADIKERKVMVEVEDIFGKTNRIWFTAYS